MAQTSIPIQNAILQRLSSDEIEALGPMVRQSLGLRQHLEFANTSNEYVYFIEDGVGSVVLADAEGHGTEIGLIGKEGMTGFGIVYGDTQSPFETFMQIEGSGLRCETARLQALWPNSPALREAVSGYARAFSFQASCTAVVNGRYNLEERLARWLLMVADRAGASFSITHEFIAVMLAVRRSGVTLAIQTLEGRGLIRAKRGSVQVIDREGLLALAKDAYGVPEREYARLWTA
jgi:CRP-like cAMP-binding protein